MTDLMSVEPFWKSSSETKDGKVFISEEGEYIVKRKLIPEPDVYAETIPVVEDDDEEDITMRITDRGDRLVIVGPNTISMFLRSITGLTDEEADVEEVSVRHDEESGSSASSESVTNTVDSTEQTEQSATSSSDTPSSSFSSDTSSELIPDEFYESK